MKAADRDVLLAVVGFAAGQLLGHGLLVLGFDLTHSGPNPVPWQLPVGALVVLAAALGLRRDRGRALRILGASVAAGAVLLAAYLVLVFGP